MKPTRSLIASLALGMALLGSLALMPRPLPSIMRAAKVPLIDGKGTDAAWARATWRPLPELWLGKLEGKADASARYKLVYGDSALYLLADVMDDTLVDIHPDPLDHYWDDDCLEAFVDADGSGGVHQYSHQAFAYHMALDGKVADLDTNQKTILLNDHVKVRHRTTGQHTLWEARISLYDKRFSTARNGRPMQLRPGQVIGFALAYCDNDHSPEREAFIGSMPIPGKDKNRAWIDASLFEKFKLR